MVGDYVESVVRMQFVSCGLNKFLVDIGLICFVCLVEWWIGNNKVVRVVEFVGDIGLDVGKCVFIFEGYKVLLC